MPWPKTGATQYHALLGLGCLKWLGSGAFGHAKRYVSISILIILYLNNYRINLYRFFRLIYNIEYFMRWYYLCLLMLACLFIWFVELFGCCYPCFFCLNYQAPFSSMLSSIFLLVPFFYTKYEYVIDICIFLVAKLLYNSKC